MMLRKIKIACLFSMMMMGMMSTALPAMTMNCIEQNQKIEKEWTLLETKDGVSCYYKIDQLGTCNNGIYLRFVNNSAANVIVNFNVGADEIAITRKITLAAGQTLDSSTEPSLAVRPLTTGEPVISFTVSK